MNQLITFDPQAIKQLDGLYCLNDLHRMAGGERKHTPSRFIRLDKTQALIKALQDIEAQKTIQDPKQGYEPHNPKNGCGQVFKVINGGSMQGVYGNRKIVYAYANWIDPYFYAGVLEVFDKVATGQTRTTSHTAEINQLCHELKGITQLLTFCGRNLALHGKQTKPEMIKELNDLLNQQQPQLNFGGASHE